MVVPDEAGADWTADGDDDGVLDTVGADDACAFVGAEDPGASGWGWVALQALRLAKTNMLPTAAAWTRFTRFPPRTSAA